MPVETQRLYEFGPFQLDPAEHRLLNAGKPVSLTPKAFQTLVVLVENQGRLMEKDELLKLVWPDTFVEESTLAQNIFTLRKQLGENGTETAYIETVPKRGYRFTAPVRFVDPADWRTVSGADLKTGKHQSVRWTRHFRVAVVVSAIAATATLIYFVARSKPAGPLRIMLVVLPVENLTGDTARDYVSDGLTEELIAQLGSLNSAELGVIARTSSMTYKRSSKTVGQIGRDLHADYALECSLRESAGETRFTAQLIRISDETHIWAHSFERPQGDLLSLQRELARIVAGEIRIGVTPQGEVRLSTPGKVNPEAYDAYVQGRFHWNERSAREMRAAITSYQEAIEKDPGFAPAYVGLADSYSMLATMREAAPNEVMPKAKDALLKALALDGSLAEAHTSLGWVMEVFDWDWTASDRELRKAIELSPNDATAHHRYAIHLAAMGRLPDAFTQMRSAEQLDPLSPVIFSSTGWVLLRGRRPDDAMRECRRALDLDPKFVRGHLCLGEAYEQKGDIAQAADEFLQGKILAGDTPEILDALKDATTRDGYQGYFRTRLAQLLAKSKTSYVSPYDLADSYVRLGDQEQALHWLQVAYEERSPYLANLQIEPRLDGLRGDARFQDLVTRVGLKNVQAMKISAEQAAAAIH